MKIYIYRDSPTLLRAITDDGGEIATHSISDGAVNGTDIETLHEFVKTVHADANVVFVTDPFIHPAIREHITAHRTKAEAPEEPTVDGHACDSCIHAHVCDGASTATRMHFTITGCEHHFAIPTED